MIKTFFFMLALICPCYGEQIKILNSGTIRKFELVSVKLDGEKIDVPIINNFTPKILIRKLSNAQTEYVFDFTDHFVWHPTVKWYSTRPEQHEVGLKWVPSKNKNQPQLSTTLLDLDKDSETVVQKPIINYKRRPSEID